LSDKVEKKPKAHPEPKFNKTQFLNSKKYAARRDIVSAVLQEDRLYTSGEVNSLIDNYLSKGVK